MEIDLTPGKYVVAVSGGVDSVALLNMLNGQKGLELVVAHFDHGIRQESAEDREFVQGLAHDYGLPFEFAEGKLGSGTSEAEAREKRYEFLRGVQKEHGAEAIITAHHQDDLLETAIINLMRGTGRRGLSSLKSTSEIKRPLLKYSKAQILDYARQNNLKWREDPTNTDQKYLRNYIRHEVVAKLSGAQRQKLLKIIEDAASKNSQIDASLQNLLGAGSLSELDRLWFAKLPHDVSKEVMLAWLRNNGIGDVTRRLLEQLVVKSKTYKINSQIDVNKLYIIKVTKKFLALGPRDR